MRHICLKGLAVLALFTAGVLALGCASNGASPGKSPGDVTAIRCDKCKTVWVRSEKSYGTDFVVVVKETPTLVCEHCDKIARAQLASGEITGGSCASCGGILSKCTTK